MDYIYQFVKANCFKYYFRSVRIVFFFPLTISNINTTHALSNAVTLFFIHHNPEHYQGFVATVVCFAVHLSCYTLHEKMPPVKKTTTFDSQCRSYLFVFRQPVWCLTNYIPPHTLCRLFMRLHSFSVELSFCLGPSNWMSSFQTQKLSRSE